MKLPGEDEEEEEEAEPSDRPTDRYIQQLFLRNPSGQAAKQLSNVLMNTRQTDASNRYINLPKQSQQQPRLCNLSDLESLTNCTAAAAATIMLYAGSIHIIQISMYIVLYIYVFYLGISLASFRKSPKTSWPAERDFEIPLRKQLADNP